MKTLNSKGKLGATPLIILLDSSGSTQNLLDDKVSIQIQPHLTKTSPLLLMVANGKKMVPESVCNARKFTMKGHEFEKDMRVRKDNPVFLGSLLVSKELTWLRRL